MSAANYEEEDGDDFELIDQDDDRLDDHGDLECLENEDEDDESSSGAGVMQRRGRKKLKLGNEKNRRLARRSLPGKTVVPTISVGSGSSSQRVVTRVDQAQLTTTTTTTTTTAIEAKRQLGVKIDRICEYALVLMHCVLYKINYYNRKTHFDKTIKYNIIVYKCKSEIVCEYISNCIECMRLLLYHKYQLETNSDSKQTNVSSNEDDTFSIGLAVLKSCGEDDEENEKTVNMLIKRYTLQIECSLLSSTISSDQSSSVDEWNFRDSLLKCLYSKDVQYPKNFKWQIQIRTHKSSIQNMNSKEDLFKLFAWRQCEQEEVTSIKSKSSSYNRLSIKPIKTMNHLGKLRIQLFIEQSIQSSNKR